MIIEALLCLSLNAFHEAASEGTQGMAAVAQVTMTRARSDESKVCEVVFQKHQFSWTTRYTRVKTTVRGKDGKLHARYAWKSYREELQRMIPKDDPRWNNAVKIAKQALDGTLPNVVGQATNFFNPHIVAPPDWAKNMKFVKIVGNHAFYLDRRQLA